MQASPLQVYRNRRAWLLQGVQMTTGKIVSVDDTFGMLTMESDSGDELILHHTAFVFDAQAALALNREALKCIERNIAQLEPECAPLQQITIQGERYAGVDV